MQPICWVAIFTCLGASSKLLLEERRNSAFESTAVRARSSPSPERGSLAAAPDEAALVFQAAFDPTLIKTPSLLWNCFPLPKPAACWGEPGALSPSPPKFISRHFSPLTHPRGSTASSPAPSQPQTTPGFCFPSRAHKLTNDGFSAWEYSGFGGIWSSFLLAVGRGRCSRPRAASRSLLGAPSRDFRKGKSQYLTRCGDN